MIKFLQNIFLKVLQVGNNSRVTKYSDLKNIFGKKES